MPSPKYESIYKEIRNEILSGVYAFGDYLPSENVYTARFGCTRNTIRRAIGILASEGFLLPQHGRGVQVIYSPDTGKSLFTIGGIESFSEAAGRNGLHVTTRVVGFEEVTADEKLSRKTGFDPGKELFHVQRIRLFDEKPTIYDENWFLKSEMPGLTEEIAGKSIYRYLEQDLGMTITNSRRRVTAEPSTKRDEKYLNLGHQHFVLAVAGQVFNTKGIMFEYTESRHRPDRVCFIQSAVRQKI
jgi:GntR family trehalose operon transcriptional repressor